MNGNPSDTLGKVTRCVREATLEVFNAYGLSVRPVDFDTVSADAFEQVSLSAGVGYTGDDVCGTLVLLAPQPVVHFWAVAASADESIRARDIVLEFSNMIFGRLKGRLLFEGFPILTWTSAKTGDDRAHRTDPARPLSALSFAGRGGRFAVRLHATFEKSFVLHPPRVPEKAPAAGDVIFF